MVNPQHGKIFTPAYHKDQFQDQFFSSFIFMTFDKV